MSISEQHFGVMSGWSTTDTIFALQQLMEKCREGQKEIYYEFIDLKKAYNQEWRFGTVYGYQRWRKKQITVGLHQGSALRPILFAILIDCLMWSIQKESPWDMLFADDVFSGETKEKVEERLVEWKAECE
ncbi:uncharacterized protein LOC119578589 [Penaeus monodon]|uniref:uncharacterized protein LOC119578589 n=1 Tax=Penaeus monodon TaxID=6687 RepID=UPI0018A7BE79|nr:uncharacterized protein LOC119578589 [Penaeus monodon]